MQTFGNCKEAIQRCLEAKTFSVAYLTQEEKTMDMHVHNCHELYYSVAGGKRFLIGNQCYDVEPGDLFVINQYESHCLSQIDPEAHERIVLSIYPDFVTQLSSPETDLTACFQACGRDRSNRLRLDSDAQKRLVYYVHKMTGSEGYGADLITRAAFIEFMIFVNQQFQESRSVGAEPSYKYNELVIDVVKYLNQHITERLVLDDVAEHFFVSKSYLCRIFKSETGTTINKYVVARRISIAKHLLADGTNVSETCSRSGFNDYVNFVKSFTRTVGMSPKRYALCSTS